MMKGTMATAQNNYTERPTVKGAATEDDFDNPPLETIVVRTQDTQPSTPANK
jgi:hypothetical protein